MDKKFTEGDMRLLVSKNLKRIRLQQNYSQLGLAEFADLASNYINDIESCKKSVSLETIAKLSTALQIEPHLFFMPVEVADNTQIYLNALRVDIQRYVNNWTESYLPPEYGKKQ